MSTCLKYVKSFNVLSMLLLSTVVVVSDVVASEQGEQWEINGFITQGYFDSDVNNFNGHSESGSFDFREVALNTAWRPNKDLLLAGQIMSRTAGDVDGGDPRVDYALLDYRFSESESGYWGVRLGRIKNPFGLYNDTRDVAFTRPSIMLPQSIYFDKARNLELSSDGAMFYGSYLMPSGQIDSELIMGMPQKDSNVEFAYLNRDWEGSFDDSTGLMWRTMYSSLGYGLRVGFTYGWFSLDFDGPDAPPLGAPGDGTIDIDVRLLSLQYNSERWSFTSEYMRQYIDWHALGGVFALDPENTAESYYAQLEYRLTPEVSLLLRRDVLYIDIDDRDGLKTQALFGRPPHTQYGKDWTVGVGWQVDHNWLLRAEWHHIKGTSWLAMQDNPDDNLREENWDLFALQATYRF